MTPKKFEKNDNNFTVERENVFFFGVLQKEILVYMLSPKMVVFICDTKRFLARIETSEQSSPVF